MLCTRAVHVIAFVVLQMPVLDMAAWMLMALSFGYCAVAILRIPDDDWDLAPMRASAQDTNRRLEEAQL